MPKKKRTSQIPQPGWLNYVDVASIPRAAAWAGHLPFDAITQTQTMNSRWPSGKGNRLFTVHFARLLRSWSSASVFFSLSLCLSAREIIVQEDAALWCVRARVCVGFKFISLKKLLLARCKRHARGEQRAGGDGVETGVSGFQWPVASASLCSRIHTPSGHASERSAAGRRKKIGGRCLFDWAFFLFSAFFLCGAS